MNELFEGLEPRPVNKEVEKWYQKLEQGGLSLSDMASPLEVKLSAIARSIDHGIFSFMVATGFKYKNLSEVRSGFLDRWYLNPQQSRNTKYLVRIYLFERMLRNTGYQTPKKIIRSLMNLLFGNNPDFVNKINSKMFDIWQKRNDFTKYDILNYLCDSLTTYERKRQGSVSTPVGLVKEIISQIYITDNSVLDPACGNGTFLLVSYEKNPNAKYYGIDISPQRCYISKYIAPFAEIWCEDSLKKDFNMKKFDIIIGNPPFQTPARTGQALWPFFVKKSFDLVKEKGMVALVLPNRFGLPGSNIRKDNVNIWNTFLRYRKLTVLNLGACSTFFNGIGTSKNYFGYFISENIKGDDPCLVITSEMKQYINVSEYEYLPQYGNEIVFSIFKKIQLWVKNNSGLTIRRAKENKDSKKPKYCIVSAQYCSLDQTVFIDPHGNAEWNFHNFSWDNFKDGMTEESLRSVLLSKLYKFMFSHIVQTIMNQAMLQVFPKIDLTQVWTDQKIYEYFGLTQKEINYIETNIK